MRMPVYRRLKQSILFTLLLSLAASVSVVQADNQRHVVIEGGDTAYSRQQALESKEQWNDTRSLRNKVNKRTEKEFDKVDKAIDGEDNCRLSKVLTAYWEPKTRRCLDSRTGKPVSY